MSHRGGGFRSSASRAPAEWFPPIHELSAHATGRISLGDEGDRLHSGFVDAGLRLVLTDLDEGVTEP